jgi:hypothetical protein
LKWDLSPEALHEAVMLWDRVQGVILNHGTPNLITWKMDADGKYSVATAYAAQFMGSVHTSFKTSVWLSDAPMRCRIFACLAFQDRCLTADVLAIARKGFPRSETCALCPSAPEKAQHLLGGCTMTLQLWCRILPIAHLPPCFLPQLD